MKLVSRHTLPCMLRLARWLGPWTPDSERPDGVLRETLTVTGDRDFEAFVFRPECRRPTGTLLLVPGLHHEGPKDPRMDRFARVLARAGVLVLSPLLPDYQRLLTRPSLVDDVDRAFEALLAHPLRPPGIKPGVFAISFGATPAMHFAARPERRDQVGCLVTFGGFARFDEAVVFALRGAEDRASDPLSRPVVYINLLDFMPDVPGDPERLADAWRRYADRTWGDPAMKAPERHRPIAHEIAATLPAEQRELFLIGASVREEDGRSEAALRRGAESFAWMDPAEALAALRCPAHFIHGREDDVIPFEHAAMLEAMVPGAGLARTHVTGLYSHAAKDAGPGARLGQIPEMARELRTMLGILNAIAAGAQMPG